jgi:hypothetical protein
MAALQLAELEESLSLPPDERAALLAEVAALWRAVGEPGEARARLTEALEIDPGSDATLAELAALAEEADQPDEALRLHASRLKGLMGPGRCDVMERMVALMPDSESERKRSLLREVVSVAPERRAPLERLIEIERAAGALTRVDSLQRRLVGLLEDPLERQRLTLEAATRASGPTSCSKPLPTTRMRSTCEPACCGAQAAGSLSRRRSRR